MSLLPVHSAEMRPDTPPHPRRRIPWSLQLFLGLLALIAMCSGWVALRGYRQITAIREIEALGGYVAQKPVGAPWLRKIIGERQMRMFDKVTMVSFNGPQVTNTGIQHLRGLSSLKQLSLNQTQVTDAGLQNLCGLIALEFLNLDQTQVTDAGLERIRSLTALRHLTLKNTQVTDAGLQHLRGLSALETLWLDDTQVTHVGVTQLQQALPNLVIRPQR